MAAPGPGQVRVKQRACGVNFIDTYFRMGMYPRRRLPFIAGNEGAGDVVAVGPGVTDIKVGDRVAYVSALGSYAEERLMPAERCVPLPAAISYEQAAGMMLKGMTAQYLLRQTFQVETGHDHPRPCRGRRRRADPVPMGQASGRYRDRYGRLQGQGGARAAPMAPTTRSSTARRTSPTRVKEITGGKLCDVVYDGVGKTTFPASLDCIRPRGMFVSFGSSSGQIDAFNINILQTKGSLFATRPTLNHYAATRKDLLATANDLFDVVGSGKVKIPVNQKYPLKDAQRAHRELEGRATTGSSILIP